MTIDELMEKRTDLIRVLKLGLVRRAEKDYKEFCKQHGEFSSQYEEFRKQYEEFCRQYAEGMRKKRKNYGLIKVPKYVNVLGPNGGYFPFPGKKLK